jgi:hypothetical protein
MANWEYTDRYNWTQCRSHGVIDISKIDNFTKSLTQCRSPDSTIECNLLLKFAIVPHLSDICCLILHKSVNLNRLALQ